MIPNRNDEPDPMPATRASGECSGIEPFSTKYIKLKKRSGGFGGWQPPAEGREAAERAGGTRGGPPCSKLQTVLFL